MGPQGQLDSTARRWEVGAPEQPRRAQDYDSLIVRYQDGAVIRLSQVARVSDSVENRYSSGFHNRNPAVVLTISRQPGSNIIETIDAINQALPGLRQLMPADVDLTVALDRSPGIKATLREAHITLALAAGLVILVVWLFLGNARAAAIPSVAIPVCLIATFAVMYAWGFSLNNLSLMALIVAAGLVVDDAIVVVEAVEHHIEHGLSPKEATFKAMEEVSGPVIAIAVILAAVFIPTAFIPGITGRLYQQFALTIAISVIISAFNALTLSPALSALLLKPKKKGTGPLQKFYDWFNRMFGRATDGYVGVCRVAVHKSFVSLMLLVGIVVLTGFFGGRVATGFLPEEDQGYMYGAVQLPDASSLQRTRDITAQAEKLIMDTPGVKYCTSVVGYNLLSGVTNTYSTFFFITLEDWAARKTPELQYETIKTGINQKLAGISGAIGFAFSPPAIPGCGTSGGATFMLEDRAGKDIEFLSTNVNTFVEAAKKRPELGSVSTTFRPTVPQLFVDVDRDKVLKQGVKIDDVYKTLQSFMGSGFVNYFNKFGRQWQVYVQAEGDYRTNIENVGQFYVRNSEGATVPLSALTNVKNIAGPEFTMRYNLYRCAQINANAAPGYSSAQAMKALEEVFAETMPPEMGFDYMGMSFQEWQAQKGVSPMVIFGFSLLCVFLILAAQYESWSLPFSVLLGTPIAVAGAFGALMLRGQENNVYAQIGLVMLIGLSAKNAILIVEFAKMEYEKGRPLLEATLEGAKLRLRPILMTSFAFILGCVPLAIASGAGAVSRQVMGSAVIGGMLAATVIGVFLIPVFYYVVEKIGGKKPVAPAEGPKEVHHA